MKITAITQDQLIIVDDVPAPIGQIGGFRMERGEWAVHFDTEIGAGHIEFLDSRSNEPLNTALYQARYAWLVSKHAEFIEWEHAQQLEREQLLEQQQVNK